MPKRTAPALSGLENKVMRVVWQHGRATAELVRTALGGDELKDSTIRTILRRLEQKGYVGHEAEGRTYIYTPKLAPRNVAANAVRSIIQRLCNGSVEDLIIGMVDHEVVSPKSCASWPIGSPPTRHWLSSPPPARKNPKRNLQLAPRRSRVMPDFSVSAIEVLLAASIKAILLAAIAALVVRVFSVRHATCASRLDGRLCHVAAART